MPRGDGTGPLGRGPMSGRGMGYCAVKLPAGGGPPSGFAGVAGRPIGTGVPRGQEIGLLQREAEAIQEELQRISTRIGEIETILEKLGLLPET